MYKRLLIDYGMINQRLNLLLIFQLKFSQKRLKTNILTKENF